jgi:hypothetical protein
VTQGRVRALREEVSNRTNPMRRNLQTILMAGLVTGLLSSMMAPRLARAESGAITTTTDEFGRKIYVNDGPPTAKTPAPRANPGESSPGPRLMYWSSTEHRYKPVPTSGAVIRAARSAASEVDTYLGRKTRSSEPIPPTNAGRLNVAFAPPAISERAIEAAIQQAAARHNVDANLVRSVIKVESNFNPNAVSRKGAMGLMQLMPETARSLNVSNPFDPEQNVDAGVRHLRKLLDNYGGDVRLTLAAYNAGSTAVARSAGIPRIAETRSYVRRITDLYAGVGTTGARVIFNPVHDPVRMERDERGVLRMSNTD